VEQCIAHAYFNRYLIFFFVRSPPEQEPVACTAAVLGPDDGQLCDDSTCTSGSVPGVETTGVRSFLSIVLYVANKIASRRGLREHESILSHIF